MKRRQVFLIVCTLAHPIVFFVCGGALQWLLSLVPAASQPGASRAVGDLYVKLLLPLFPVIPLLSRAGIPPLTLSVTVVFFLCNGFLWALTLWYARIAWRRVRNLPPIKGRA
jgi:hypothetical protein